MAATPSTPPRALAPIDPTPSKKVRTEPAPLRLSKSNLSCRPQLRSSPSPSTRLPSPPSPSRSSTTSSAPPHHPPSTEIASSSPLSSQSWNSMLLAHALSARLTSLSVRCSTFPFTIPYLTIPLDMEPLLMESKRRFVLFPIQYQDVCVAVYKPWTRHSHPV